ncbi:MAG: 6-bladed beta-propeller [Sediminibacterium sp.]|nr:6-bladed beta-propeller [Sediminibacterium sp.]
MRFVLLYLLIIIVLCSCQIKEIKHGQIINSDALQINLSNRENYYSLDQVVDTIWYTSLETKDSITPLRKIDKLVILNNKIYVLDIKYAAVKVFGISGKYEHDIGGLGTSKGLYIKIADLVYNKFRNTICILCNSPRKKVFEYSLNGSFLREISLENGSTAFGIRNPNAFYYFLNKGGEGLYEDYNLVLTDSGNTIKEAFFNVPENIKARIGTTGGIYACEDSLYFNPPLTNTYYALSDNGTAKSSYTISFGKDNLSSKFESLNDMMQNIRKYSHVGRSFVKDSNFVGLNYIANGAISKQAFYSLKSKHVAIADSSNPLNYLFRNEIFQSHDTLITAAFIPQLKKWAKTHEKIVKNRLPKLYDEIMRKKESDNPILIFYKLKYF